MADKENSKTTCMRCDKHVKQMGLCATHYSQYYKEIRGLTESQRDEFDAVLIKAGLLAPRKKSGPNANDPYAKLAFELFGKTAVQAKSVAEPLTDYKATQILAALRRATDEIEKIQSLDDEAEELLAGLSDGIAATEHEIEQTKPQITKPKPQRKKRG